MGVFHLHISTHNISLLSPHLHSLSFSYSAWQERERKKEKVREKKKRKITRNCLTNPKKTTTSVCQMSARYKESCKGHRSAIHTVPTSFRRVPRAECLRMLGTEQLRAWIDAEDNKRWGRKKE